MRRGEEGGGGGRRGEEEGGGGGRRGGLKEEGTDTSNLPTRVISGECHDLTVL